MLPKPPNCQPCTFHTVGQSFVPPEGSPTAMLRLCGEAPGEEEAEEGRPFVGKSGGILRRQAGFAGLADGWCQECRGKSVGEQRECRACAGSRRTFGVYIYNLVACRPPNNRFELIPREAPGYCMGQYVAPAPAGSVTYLVGGKALVHHFPELTTVKGMGSIERWHGSVLPLGEGWAVPVLHPAGVMRGWAWLPTIGFDLAGGLGLVGKRPGVDPPFRMPERIEKPPAGASALAIDIETAEGGEINLVGVTGDGVKVWQGEQHEARRLQPAIDAAEVVFAHNAKFDVTRLEAVGLKFRRERVVDTMNAAVLWQSTIVRKAAGLDDVTALVLPGEQTWWKGTYGSRRSPEEIELTRGIWQRLWPRLTGFNELEWFRWYNMTDVVMTWRIGMRLKTLLSAT